MKQILFITTAAVSLVTTGLFAQPAVILEKKFPATFRVTHTITLKNKGLDLSRAVNPRFVLALPLPGSNDYQDVSDLMVSGGEILEYEGKKEKYVRCIGKAPIKKIVVKFKLTAYKMFPRWELIKELHPYDTARPEYALNTKRDEGRIQADNPIIITAADKIRKESGDLVDYVKKAYLWEQKTLKWKNSGGTIDEIFANGGGECSSLSTVLISLLRNNGIPARLMVGFVIRNGKGDSHVWSEFYLEGYGWIPIDPAFYGGMENDPLYFGYYDGRRFFMSRGHDYTIHDGTAPVYAGSFGISNRYSYGGGKITGSYEYKTDVSVTTIDVGHEAESAYYGDPEYIRAIQEKAFSLINERRKVNNLPLFQFSPELNSISTAYLFPREDEDPLKKSGIRYTRFGRWNFHTGIPTLAPVEKASSLFPWKELENPEYNRLGIGYRYDKGIHKFYFVLLKANE